MSNISLIKGANFVFIDDDNEINFRVYPYSGKEEVYFNGQLVSFEKSYGFNSYHEFHMNGNSYELQAATKITKIFFRCVLKKGGVLHSSKNVIFKPKWTFLRVLLGVFIILFLSYIDFTFQLPSWLFKFIFVTSLALYGLICIFRFRIVDEDVSKLRNFSVKVR